MSEGPEDYDKDDLDALTSPVSANPFEPKAKVDIGKVTPKGPSSVISKKPQDPTATQPRHVAHSKPMPGQNKPAYPGKFLGQSVDMGGQYSAKNVSFQKKLPPGPGQRRQAGGVRSHDVSAFPATAAAGPRGFGKVAVKSHDRWVWDGQDWVTPDEFDQKFRKR